LVRAETEGISERKLKKKAKEEERQKLITKAISLGVG
jgi:hypothetical protein